jgi:hypothetical protein
MYQFHRKIFIFELSDCNNSVKMIIGLSLPLEFAIFIVKEILILK